MPVRLGLIVLCSLVLMLSGCATIVTGSNQLVILTTEPPGAVCILKRDGLLLGVVNPTPGSFYVSKSHSKINVECSKDGFLDAVGLIGEHFQPMTFGNIILGGLIGIVVDATSGATAEYESLISLKLVPSEFENIDACNDFFDREREALTVQSKLIAERIKEKCEPSDCDRQLQLAKDEEKVALDRIERQRNSAKIRIP